MKIHSEDAYHLLHRLGATANYTGFSYLVRALQLCAEEPERLLLVTKWLYPDVAKQYGTNWKAVERNIRTVGRVIWNSNRPLLEDLARRDFTINAMAWEPSGLTDPFGGRADLAAGVIRCVREPERRFGEDALRLLRALRFAAQLDFRLEEGTAAGVRACAPQLACVSRERVAEELKRLVCGPAAGRVLLDCPEVLTGQVLPELAPAVGFDQRNPHHSYDVYTHCVRALERVPAEPGLRLAALLHDVGKPGCCTVDREGVGHFYGHAAAGAELADACLRRLRLDNALRERVVTLIRRHDLQLEPEPQIGRAHV